MRKHILLRLYENGAETTAWLYTTFTSHLGENTELLQVKFAEDMKVGSIINNKDPSSVIQTA